MSRGFQPDPVAEHAALVELAAAIAAWQTAEEHARTLAADALDRGCRANVIADALGMSRATLYRWLT